MNHNIFFRRLSGLVALLCLLSVGAMAQNLTLDIRKSSGQKYEVYALPASSGSVSISGSSVITVVAPKGDLAVTASSVTSTVGGWYNVVKETDGTTDYFSFVPRSAPFDLSLTSGAEVKLFDFATTGACSGGNISLNTKEEQTVNTYVGTYIEYIAGSTTGSNVVTGFGNNSIPCQDLAVTSPASISTANNTPKTGNVADDTKPTGGTGTYSYASVACDGSAPSPTAPAATSATQQGGTISVSSTGAYTYTPKTGFSGTDQFCVRICSGNDCKVVTYSITVGAAPLTITTTASTTAISGTPKTGSVADDAKPAGGTGTYSYASVACDGSTPSPTAPAATASTQKGGSISVDGSTGVYTYKSVAGFVGTDQFCIRVCSGNDCKVVTYTVSVSSNCPTFTLPTLSK